MSVPDFGSYWNALRDKEELDQLTEPDPGDLPASDEPGFKSVYGQLMSINPVGGGLSPRQQAALRDLDGLMVVAEHVMQGVPVGAGAHSTICALLMDAYAKGRAAESTATCEQRKG